ncbi:hypothetical protein C8R45DRAFT_980344, partial [Mycena sanguinolenta]
RFSVHWKNISYNGDTGGDLYMDGILCGKNLLHGRDLRSLATFDGVKDGRSVKPFVFSPLELTDDDSFLDCSSHRDLGLIELGIRPVQVIRENNGIYSSPNALSEVKVHERSKKAITQQITLAEPELLAEPEPSARTRSGPNLVKFSFKYRPADVLRANGIMSTPRQPKRKASAEPLRSPSPEYNLADAEEEKMLLERLNALAAKRLKIEKKPRVKVDPDILVDLTQGRKKRVKTESKPTFVQGEIIDLT